MEMKLGLALSGGGIKSYAQLPILKTMDEINLEIDVVSGTSMGSAIGALLASGVDINEMYDLALDIEKKLHDTKLFMKPSPKLLPFHKDKIKGGYVDGQVLEDIFESVLDQYGVHHISDVKIPIAIPSVDLRSGKVVVFVSHPELFNADPSWDVISDISLAKAVRASCSFPLVISALEYEDYLLVDGGVKMNLPSLLLKAYDTKDILAITMTSGAGFEEEDSFFAIANRIYDLMVESYDETMEDHVDLMINVPIGDVWVFELGEGMRVIDEGEVVAKKVRETLHTFKKDRSLIDKIFG